MTLQNFFRHSYVSTDELMSIYSSITVFIPFQYLYKYRPDMSLYSCYFSHFFHYLHHLLNPLFITGSHILQMFSYGSWQKKLCQGKRHLYRISFPSWINLVRHKKTCAKSWRPHPLINDLKCSQQSPYPILS